LFWIGDTTEAARKRLPTPGKERRGEEEERRGASLRASPARAAKKRGRAIKLGREAKNLQVAIDAQLDTLGICSLIRS
jgi:hypothetical protein